MSKHSRGRGYSVAAIVLVLVGLFLAGGQLVPANYKGSTYKCIVEGPWPALADSPPVVTGDLSYWPLGRSCTWDSTASGGTITTYSGSEGWTLVVTGLLIGGPVIALWRGARLQRRGGAQLSAWAEDEAAS
jgi:hypothetical protein